MLAAGGKVIAASLDRQINDSADFSAASLDCTLIFNEDRRSPIDNNEGYGVGLIGSGSSRAGRDSSGGDRGGGAGGAQCGTAVGRERRLFYVGCS